MKRIDVLEVVRADTEDSVVVATCGLTCRELASLGARSNELYLVNSMGLATSVGLGIALGCQERVVVVEGDGGLLMGLSSLATLALTAPANLAVIVVDNGVHASTGGQPTAASRLDLAAIARGFGMETITASTTTALETALAETRVAKATTIVHCPIHEQAIEAPYFQPDPATIASRVHGWLDERRTERAGATLAIDVP